MNYDDLLKVALTGGLAFGGASIATADAASNGANDRKSGEKKMVWCHDINAAHDNGCKSTDHSCASQDSKARNGNAFVAVPAGLRPMNDGDLTALADRS